MKIPGAGFFALLIAISLRAGEPTEPTVGPEGARAAAYGAVDFRYARLLTTLDQRDLRFDAGRQSSLGLLVTARMGRLVADFAYEHDYETFYEVLARIDHVDSGEFSRDRFEYAVGYAPTPAVSVVAGARNERIAFSNRAFGGNNPLGSLDLEYFAFLLGARAETSPELPVGFFASFRTYLGGTDVASVRTLTDTKGYRIEAGVPIRLGRSVLRVTPGFVYERLAAGTRDLELTTMRTFLNFGIGSPGN